MKGKLLTILFSVILLSLSAQNIWINEFHYDNASTDANEFIEIVFEMAPGDDLSDYEIVLYNGNNGTQYNQISLDTFTAGAVEGNFSFFYALVEGIQNGEPDGIALVHSGSALQFISYEGSFTATDGPANGLISEDIGVEETSATEEGMSLQLTGEGAQYDHFSWMEPSANTMGTINTGQSFGGAPDPAITVTSPNGGEEWEQGSTHTITWSNISFDGNVNIELLESNRSRDVLASNIENIGSWQWEIPEDQEIHPNYSIKISGVEDDDPFDISDAEFAIVSPAVPEPYTIYEIQYTEDESGDSPYVDELTITSGIITAIFSSTFFIQDGDGAWNGICVYPGEFDISNLSIGNEVEITATIAEYNGKTELADITNIEILNEEATLPNPEIIATGAISMSDLYNPESWEGVYVQMNDVVVTNPDLGYGNWEIDDGMDNSAPCIVGAAGDYTYEPVEGDSFSAVRGIVDFGYGDFKIEPRNDADLMNSALIIEPAILEFLTYEDCDNGKSFTLTNSGDMDIVINNITIDADFSGAAPAIETVLEFPITLSSLEDLEILITIAFMTNNREIEEGTVNIETSIGNFEVILHYDNNLNSGFIDSELDLTNANLSNYPNPFNPSTTIYFNLLESSNNSKIVIYNSKGQEIKTYRNSLLSVGENSIIWDGTDENGDNVTSGIYFYRLFSEDKSIATKKMLLLK
jgi:hypothetical protein